MNDKKHAPVSLMVDKVDKETGEIQSMFLDNHGVAFPQKDGEQLAIRLNFIPVGPSARYYVKIKDLGLKLPESEKHFPVRASRHYLREDEAEPGVSWATMGIASLTKKNDGLVITLHAVPAELSLVIFFQKRTKDEE